MPPAAKQKLPVAGAAALRAVRWDCPDAWSDMLLKRIFSGCMRVFGPWDHSAAQHVGGEIDPNAALVHVLFPSALPL